MVLRGFFFLTAVASLALNALGVLAYMEMDKYVDLDQLTEEMIASRKQRQDWDELPASWKETKDKLFRSCEGFWTVRHCSVLMFKMVLTLFIYVGRCARLLHRAGMAAEAGGIPEEAASPTTVPELLL